MRAPIEFMAVAVSLMAGCAYPEYTVDETVGLVELPPPPSDCPTNLAGPPLVGVRGGYCIDSTEVTWGDYEEWLLTAIAPGEQPATCRNNPPLDDVGPFRPPDADYQSLPVVGVDWCDAFEYCRSVGKRLCGHIEGGDNDYDHFDDAASSQWYNACSSGGRNEYPYGHEYDSSVCYTETERVGPSEVVAAIPVGERSRCQASDSGYAGVLDLSGNVAEWEDSCRPGGNCRIRGGANHDPESGRAELASRCGADDAYSPALQAEFIGFRCCYPP